MDIKPIETEYKGYKFRSRLEARWAVFFDALGIKWEYESEGFKFNGKTYLPDFYLPTFDGGLYCEVKPDGGDFSKSYDFAKSSHDVRIWLCEGVPSYRVYTVLEWLPIDDNGTLELQEIPGIPNADQAWDSDRMFVQPGYENDDGSIPEDMLSSLGDKFINAVLKAKQARFEHGERPKI